VVCSGKVGLKTDGLAQGGRGFRKFSLLFEDRAESVVGLGIIGLGANGGSQFAGGIVEFTLLPEGDRVYGASGCEGSRDSALRSSATASGSLSWSLKASPRS
jgi:hypothetical protein